MAKTTVVTCDICGATVSDPVADQRPWGKGVNVRVLVRPLDSQALAADLCPSCYAEKAEEAARLIREWADV